jgi:hypothetical protein
MWSISRVADVCINTVSGLLVDAGKACAEHYDRAVRNVTSKRIQADEIWSFCYAKQKILPRPRQPAKRRATFSENQHSNRFELQNRADRGSKPARRVGYIDFGEFPMKAFGEYRGGDVRRR